MRVPPPLRRKLEGRGVPIGEHDRNGGVARTGQRVSKGRQVTPSARHCHRYAICHSPTT
jgi:hypothetical protein